MALRLSEWIVVAYLVYLAGAALLIQGPAGRRRRVIAGSAAVIAAVLWIATLSSGNGMAIRNIAPALYLLMMYWLPAKLVTASHMRFEMLLQAIDRRCVPGAPTFDRRAPRLVVETLELAYLFCYPLIPIGLLCLYLGRAMADVDRYWTAVLFAGALSYGVLPWLPTRPPRETDAVPTRVPGCSSVIRSVNMRVTGHASVGWNTFPSGHVATALAAALAVADPLPLAGAALGLVAIGISIAASTGRYHYVPDIVAGVVVALIAFGVSRLA